KDGQSRMDATEIHKKIHALKDAALFYIDPEFVVVGVYTDRFDRMMKAAPGLFVGEYTRKAKLGDIVEDMEWARAQGKEAI
ncbi:MAG: hypothetical protein ACREXU_13570, partial [Gammaproteobacteria bacterium]